MSDEELIKIAENQLRPNKKYDFYMADVGCALIGIDGEIYTGACIGGGLSICAEQSAISQMVSKVDPVIKKLVAVWRSEEGELYVLPPCGRCREFIRNVSQDNLETDIILGKEHVVKLKDLLPYHGWHAEKA
jgi:cytidine deaminase